LIVKVYYVTQVLKQGKTLKRRIQNTYEFRNTKPHLLRVDLGASVKIEIVIENLSVKLLVIVTIALKRYPRTYYLI